MIKIKQSHRHKRSRSQKVCKSWNVILIDDHDLDHICHVHLLEGDIVTVKWPDGTKTREKVFIEGKGRAYVHAKFRGADCRIYLAGLDVKLFKAKKT
jgi:hypothetical protein